MEHAEKQIPPALCSDAQTNCAVDLSGPHRPGPPRCPGRASQLINKDRYGNARGVQWQRQAESRTN